MGRRVGQADVRAGRPNMPSVPEASQTAPLCGFDQQSGAWDSDSQFCEFLPRGLTLPTLGATL